ncbi:unnamed protein product [Linum tenue]|uniref:Thioredoxin domain-containing protein n=1 Tax=Linum tenue TaxID=586396 RepID=A0AAV0MBJ3_9ROSI|nr:unnamed protein product [Linum tenue]
MEALAASHQHHLPLPLLQSPPQISSSLLSSSGQNWSFASATKRPRSSYSSSLGSNPFPNPKLVLPSSSYSTVRCGASSSSSAITQITEAEFPSVVLSSDRPVLVEFVANWCGPCRLISPAMEWLAKEYADTLKVVKIDHDANPKLIEEYKVYGLPALMLFKDGQEVAGSRREGAITKAKLKEYVDSLLDSISVA